MRARLYKKMLERRNTTNKINKIDTLIDVKGKSKHYKPNSITAVINKRIYLEVPLRRIR